MCLAADLVHFSSCFSSMSLLLSASLEWRFTHQLQDLVNLFCHLLYLEHWSSFSSFLPPRYEELRYWYDCLCYEEELRQYHDYIAAIEQIQHHEVLSSDESVRLDIPQVFIFL